MTKGTLYCVCNEAEEDVCQDCEKGKRLQPDHTLNCATWPREGTEKAVDPFLPYSS